MTLSILGVSVESAAPAPSPRGQAVPISAAGVNDAAAIARQQLPSAVPAPAALAAYSAHVTPQPKPANRAATSSSPSAFDAQRLAQEEGGEESTHPTPHPHGSSNARGVEAYQRAEARNTRTGDYSSGVGDGHA